MHTRDQRSTGLSTADRQTDMNLCKYTCIYIYIYHIMKRRSNIFIYLSIHFFECNFFYPININLLNQYHCYRCHFCFDENFYITEFNKYVAHNYLFSICR